MGRRYSKARSILSLTRVEQKYSPQRCSCSLSHLLRSAAAGSVKAQMNHNRTALCQQHQPNISSSSPVNPCSGTCTCNTWIINGIVPQTNMPHQQLGISGTRPSNFANPPFGIVASSPTWTITGRLTPKRHKSLGGFGMPETKAAKHGLGMPETAAANQPSGNCASPAETMTGNDGKSTYKEITNRDWAGLATELLLSILERLPIKDYVRFGSVCVSWYQTVATKLVSPAPHLPWLLVSPLGGSTTHLIFNPFSDKVDFHLQEPWHLNPLAITMAGYIMYQNVHTAELVVKNPLTGSCLPFPSVATLPPEVQDILAALPPEVRQILISSAAALLSGSTITAVAIAYTYGDGLKAAAFARLGDSKWTFFGDSVPIASMIFHRGLLYVLTTDGRILTWDPRVHPAPLLTLATHSLAAKCSFVGWPNYILVESSTGGDLLQVVDNSSAANSRRRGEPPEYKVFKLDTAGPKWCSVSNLCEEDALMLSPRGVVCISTREFPELRQNCIYSTFYDEPEGALNVFDLGEGRVVNYHPLPEEGYSGFRDWFIPSLG